VTVYYDLNKVFPFIKGKKIFLTCMDTAMKVFTVYDFLVT